MIPVVLFVLILGVALGVIAVVAYPHLHDDAPVLTEKGGQLAVRVRTGIRRVLDALLRS